MISPEKLTIETPEQIPLEFPLAGVGSRFLALAIDTLLQAGGLLAIGILAAVILPAEADVWRGEVTWTAAILLLAAFFLYYGYFALFEAVWAGQTPGKRWMGLRVILESGHPITAYEALARNIVRIVDQIPGIYAVGIVAALLNARNKRVGDYVAGTVVVREVSFEERAPLRAARPRSDLPVHNAAMLAAEEVRLIEAFLQRRHDLGEYVRWETGRKIYARLMRRMGLPADDAIDPEEMMEALLAERRRVGV